MSELPSLNKEGQGWLDPELQNSNQKKHYENKPLNQNNSTQSPIVFY